MKASGKRRASSGALRRPLARRHVAGQRVGAPRGERDGASSSHLPDGVGKPPSAKGAYGVGHDEPDAALALQPLVA